MKNIEDINKAAIKKIVANKKITDFSPGEKAVIFLLATIFLIAALFMSSMFFIFFL